VVSTKKIYYYREKNKSLRSYLLFSSTFHLFFKDFDNVHDIPADNNEDTSGDDDSSSDNDSDTSDDPSEMSDLVNDNWEEGIAEDVTSLTCMEQYTIKYRTSHVIFDFNFQITSI
jgi:hypothetical protein